MSLLHPVVAVIRKRSSWRSYTDQRLTPEHRERLESLVRETHVGPFGNPVRFRLVDTPPPDFLKMRSYGTYGMIKGASTYLIGAVARRARNMEDFGYCFERLILHATDLGLRTCWIGGTLDRSRFGELMGVMPDEVVPAVSPVGYGTSRRALRDVVVRLGAGSHKRYPWPTLFFHKTFSEPLTEAGAGGAREVLDMVRLAPSASNQQPWRIVMDTPRTFHIFQQRNRLYGKLTKTRDVDMQSIDIGIAMCHFELTARESGLEGGWTHRPPALPSVPPRTEYKTSWVMAE